MGQLYTKIQSIQSSLVDKTAESLGGSDCKIHITHVVSVTDLVEDDRLVQPLQHGTLEHDHFTRPRNAAGLGGRGHLGGDGEGGRGRGRLEPRLNLYPSDDD